MRVEEIGGTIFKVEQEVRRNSQLVKVIYWLGTLIKIMLCKLVIYFTLDYVLNYLIENIGYFLSRSRKRFDVLKNNNKQFSSFQTVSFTPNQNITMHI